MFAADFGGGGGKGGRAGCGVECEGGGGVYGDVGAATDVEGLCVCLEAGVVREVQGGWCGGER